jgi:hypothetical protein
MSFDLMEVRRLQRVGGTVWEKYRRLLAEADAAAHDSPAHKALAEFQMAWKQDPAGATAAAEQEAKEIRT